MRCRRGLTLVELLVVLIIVAILAGIAVPMMRPALEGRRIREAARAVNVYLGAARNKALASRTHVGVMFQRMDNEAGASMILHQIKVPPPYGGEAIDSVASVTQRVASGIATLTANFSTRSNASDPAFDSTLVNSGDLIQFNGQGLWYSVVSVTGTQIKATTVLPVGQQLPWPKSTDAKPWSQPVSYQILRQPTKSPATPLQLPMTTVVDLVYSGTDTITFYDQAAANPKQPVYVLFSPNGAVEGFWLYGSRRLVIDPIYLLVGRLDKVGATAAGERNWEDFNNLWVTLNPGTGMVTAAPVDLGADTDGDGLTDDVYGSRTAARQGYSMGGR